MDQINNRGNNRLTINNKNNFKKGIEFNKEAKIME